MFNYAFKHGITFFISISYTVQIFTRHKKIILINAKL